MNTAQLIRESRNLHGTESKRNTGQAPHFEFPPEVGSFAKKRTGVVHHSLSDLLNQTEKNKKERETFTSRRRTETWTTALFDDDLNTELEDSNISSRVKAQIPSIKSLRTSLGSEVPDMELQLQMEAARARAASNKNHDNNESYALAFMDLHHKDGTEISLIEKIAMSSLPSQLPDPAATSFNKKSSTRERIRTKARAKTSILSSKTKKKGNVNGQSTKRNRTKANTKKGVTSEGSSSNSEGKKSSISSQEVSGRVSHNEEIELATMIQRGVELHNIKKKFEEENQRDITRQEWTSIAKLESPKKLRRLVSDYRKAKNKLVMANMGLVHAVVRSRLSASQTTAGGISYEELVQEGSLGLMRAAELFDPGRGLRFSTYATIWIKGVLGNSSVSETITLPLREKNKINKINKSIEELCLENNDSSLDSLHSYKPSDKEIAKRSGLKEKDIKEVLAKMSRAKNVLSLDYQYDSRSRSGTESSKYSALHNDKNLMDDVDLVEKLQLRADVVAALSKNLDPREARLMRLRYGLKDGKTRSIRECGEAMGISRPRAQQLAMGCLKKLREADDAMSLQEYLLSIA